MISSYFASRCHSDRDGQEVTHADDDDMDGDDEDEQDDEDDDDVTYLPLVTLYLFALQFETLETETPDDLEE